MSQRVGKLTNRIVRHTGETTPKRLRRLVASLSHKDRCEWIRVTEQMLAKADAK